MWKPGPAFLLLTAAAVWCRGQEPRLEDLRDKTVLLFAPHPDDDVFAAGGTIALLNRNHNKVLVVLY